MSTTECTQNPQFPKKKSHAFQSREIDCIVYIMCDYCDAPMNHPITTRFLNHVTIENLTDLTTDLIQKVLTPAEQRLAEHMMKEML